MDDQPKCRSCGRMIRAIISLRELQRGKPMLCRTCNREPRPLQQLFGELLGIEEHDRG